MKTMGGNEPFDWNVLVPHIVNPTKVAVIEAMSWIGVPLSASELEKVFDDEEFGLSRISYHVRTLAKAGILRMVRQRQVRGSIQTFYVFS
jgi:Helix-turn-helix domain